MRIVMLVHNARNCGTFNRAHSLARNLVARGHEVTLFAGASGRGAFRRNLLDQVEVIEPFDPLSARARQSGLSPFALVDRFWRMKGRRWDVVHCFDHRPTVALPGLVLSRRRKIPCIFDWADLWGFDGIASERGPISRVTLGAFDNILETSVRRRADGLTVINRALQKRAEAHFSAPIHLLPVGANSDVIRPQSKQEARRRLGFSEDAAIALHAALAPYDVEYLARSFIELAKIHPKAQLIIVGRRFSSLERLIADAGLAKQLFQFSIVEREELAGMMACADVLLLPYTNRPVNLFRYPNKLGDYLSAARPIVTNPTGDLGRLVAEERVGLVVEETPLAFAAAIKQLFDDEALREEIGRRGRAFAETKLDWRFLAEGLERFYGETLARAH